MLEALADTRIVAVEGPRQSGKSTLCGHIASERHMRTVTLDDANTRRGALDDPQGFVAGLDGPAFIDELQRAPDLVLALKMAVDRDPRPGRYLVSGSASLLLSPRIGDSLAGRIERVPLRPFTQAELERRLVPEWLDGLWKGAGPPHMETELMGRIAHAHRIVAGGFPAAVTRTHRRRAAWFTDYIASLVARDVPDLVDVRRPDLLPALLTHLAAGSGSLASMRPIAQALAADEKTIRAYLRLLELLHLVVRVPAWTPGFAARAVRAPRLFVEDSGLMSHLLAVDDTRVANDDALSGRAYESFVAMELARLLPHTQISPTMRHWRSAHGDEVDVILEDRAGRVVAIEIKAGATVRRANLRGINSFRRLADERFVAGLVLCTARQTTPLGDRIWAVPIEALWTSEAPA
ncbi:MAG TPA: ATP-binding protein [Solirubrobacteraceae bacterium]|nr:ATP-binding protein [Solirubrobacteraceae bacterium]